MTVLLLSPLRAGIPDGVDLWSGVKETTMNTLVTHSLGQDGSCSQKTTMNFFLLHQTKVLVLCACCCCPVSELNSFLSSLHLLDPPYLCPLGPNEYMLNQSLVSGHTELSVMYRGFSVPWQHCASTSAGYYYFTWYLYSIMYRLSTVIIVSDMYWFVTSWKIYSSLNPDSMK